MKKDFKFKLLDKPNYDELKDIEGFEGLYAVTRDGNVWSYPKEWISGNGTVRKHNGKWLKQHKNAHSGLKHVNLCNNCFHQTSGLHMLVAEAYLENPENKKCVMHIDGNIENNCVDNLRWYDRNRNPLYMTKVSQYTLDNMYINTYDSVMDASRATKIRRGDIYNNLYRKIKKNKVFIWEYA